MKNGFKGLNHGDSDNLGVDWSANICTFNKNSKVFLIQWFHLGTGIIQESSTPEIYVSDHKLDHCRKHWESLV